MMLTTKTSRFLLLICMGMLMSCSRENFLDIQPLGRFIPNTVEDYRLLLDNVNGQPVDGQTITQGFNEKHLLPFLVTDNIGIFEGQPVDANLRSAYLFAPQLYGPQQEDRAWQLYYQQIFLANVILDGLNSVTNGTTEEIEQLRAEARLHRAFAYFQLVNIYGVHYDPSSANSDLGVPLRLGIELENVDLTRNSVQEVYDFVTEEILSSIEALPNTVSPNFSFRPSKAAAWGLMSKVYLFQAQFDLALSAVSNALNLTDGLTDFNQIDAVDGVRNFPPVPQDQEIVWFKDSPSDAILFELTLTDELLSLFDNDDLRNEWLTLLTISDDIGERPIYNAGEDNQNFSDGINTPDLYLIRAECHARLNNIQQANDNLNRLRINRFATDGYAPVAINNAAALLNFIKEERRRELFKSSDRMFDIKRYSRFDNDNITLTHEIGGDEATLAPNSPNWAFPIGQLYINQNPEIIQNPRE